MASSLHCGENLDTDVAAQLLSDFRHIDLSGGRLIVDRFACLLSNQGAYRVEDYASHSAATVSTSWRRRIVEWLYQVSVAFQRGIGGPKRSLPVERGRARHQSDTISSQKANFWNFIRHKVLDPTNPLLENPPWFRMWPKRASRTLSKTTPS